MTMTMTLPTYRPNGPRSEDAPVVRWVRKHLAQLALAVGVGVLGGVLLFFIVLNRERLAERAADQLSMARGQAGARKVKEALQTLDTILETNRSSPAAMQAYVMKGELLLADNKAKEAEAVYVQALAQATEPAYRALFLSGQAYCAAGLEKWEEAAALNRQFLKEFPEHFLAPRVYMDLGRAEMGAGRWEDAQRAFEKLVTLYPKSVWVADAQALLAETRSHRPVPPPAARP
jgi:tetratricopeptide (TPR) repeat protein